MAIYCFDLDNTLCHSPGDDYLISVPFINRIQKVNELFETGHQVIIFTARGSKTGTDWQSHTLRQLSDWGLKFHDLRFGKPYADFYIDDKAVKDSDFNWS